ncbi:hypothetical protein MGYG_05903 [Nannizzia gypsea CBS 118893]|uniref:Triacylglycerol lipase n=1 Tax=Arthroderma gypseum (strain ATCC MYA-4604 / CBS 118893) TaxID=535722 RepID=E4UZW5_ARTGP|nr:hypothetical protein MGYG_05903 [Nannizzia gypsea CBS 118893]EFR02902.1 hypothetical protein MGYG_05903 [Nannizzia gypsea CBS 118893]
MASQQSSAEEPFSQPRIFLLSLETEPWFDDMYKGLIDSLLSKAKVQRATKPDPALRYLSGTTPDAIFATDPALLNPKYATVLEKVISYVRSGGTIIFGGLFSSFAKPDHLNRFFTFSWSLPWKSGSYHRTTVHVNTNCQGIRLEGLQPSYSQKALHLKNVPPESRLYAANEDSRIESNVFYPDPISDITEAAIVFAPYESGRIGYIGDVNGEDGSHAVIVAMCKL